MNPQHKTINVNDKMQTGYSYILCQPMGENSDKRFTPQLTPKQMLQLGVFGGKYLNDCRNEYPEDWFINAKISAIHQDPKLNYYKINASQPLNVWRAKGWIYFEDPRGWFQWYCRYYLGRRIAAEDDRQIKRWVAMKRHINQVKKNCLGQDLSCRKKQRQALLHWAYDSRRI